MGINVINKKVSALNSDKRFSEIFKGSVWALSASVLSAIMNMIINIVVARFYGADSMGALAVITSFLIVVTIFTVMGTGTSILRLIPEHMIRYSPSSAFKIYLKTQNLVISVSLVAGFIFYCGADFLSEKVFSKPQLSFFFALAAIFIVFRSLMTLNTQAIRSLKLIRIFAFIQALPVFSQLIMLILATKFLYNNGNPIFTFLGGLFITALTGWIIMVNEFKKKIHPGDQIEDMPVRSIISISMPMLMTSAMNIALGQTGVIILGMFREEAEVGYYSIAVKLATLTSIILNSINSMAAPKFSELYHSGKIDELLYVARKASKLIFYCTIPFLTGLIICGKPILSILFGSEFSIAYLAMIILVAGQFIHSISGSTGIFMNMTGNQIKYRNIIFFTALFNILLNFLIIPKYGYYGAAFTSAFCVAGWNLATLLFIKKKYGRSIGYLPGFRLE